jgi:hypothetical protein
MIKKFIAMRAKTSKVGAAREMDRNPQIIRKRTPDMIFKTVFVFSCCYCDGNDYDGGSGYMLGTLT